MRQKSRRNMKLFLEGQNYQILMLEKNRKSETIIECLLAQPDSKPGQQVKRSYIRTGKVFLMKILMDWHERQINQILQHADKHRRNGTNFIKEQTCKACYPIDSNDISEQFEEFWKWYKETMDADDFSGKTIMIFRELMTRNLENIIEGAENIRISSLIWSIKYRSKPNYTVKELRARIMMMIGISEKFTRNMEDAINSYKTGSTGDETKENSPEKHSPEKTSPKREGSPEKDKEEIYGEGSSSTEKPEILEDYTELWKEVERAKLERKLKLIGKISEGKTEEEINSFKTLSEYIGKGIGITESKKSEENIRRDEIIIESLDKKKGKKFEWELELEKDDEYSAEIIDELKIRLEKKYGKKDYTLDNLLEEELEIIEDELELEQWNEEKPEIFMENESGDENEKLIKGSQESLSLTLSSKESTEEEIVEKEFELGNINTNWIHFGFEDLNLENLFEEQQPLITMALNIVRASFFEGGPNEDPAEWVREFNRVANANDWTNDDADDNLRLKMAKAHLKGEAADWCEENGATLSRWNNGNAANQLAALIVTRFATPDKKQRWHQEFDEVRQSPGESVEEYAKRFNKAAKKLGNDITDIGKAGAFTRGLLPAVKQLAVLGDRSTLTNAMESARRAEMSAMGYAKQMIPEESLGTNNTGSNVFREMKKDKTERDIEDLTKQMEKMMMMIQNNGNNNNGYRRKDFSEVRCYNCGKMGHYKSRCPEITGQRNWNNNEQDNRRNDRNYEGRNENNRNYERRNENNRNYEGRNENNRNYE